MSRVLLTEDEYARFKVIDAFVRRFNITSDGPVKVIRQGDVFQVRSPVSDSLQGMVTKNQNAFTGQTVRSWGLAIVGNSFVYYQATDYFSSGLLISSSPTGTVTLTGTDGCTT